MAATLGAGTGRVVTMSPTQLTLRHLRDEGWPLVEVVETYNPHSRTRHDLFGIIDIVALRPGETLAVQATSAANVSSRIRKIAESPAIDHVREAGWTVRVFGWRKKSGRWELARDVDCS